jgi:PDZ domain
MRNMKEFARFALATLLLLGMASAQKLPPVDVFGGYSYLAFDQPASGLTPYEQLKLNGWDASLSVGLLHHLAVEADISGHQVNNCASAAGFTCKNFSYMFGPRLTLGDRSKRLTFFAHGLFGRDQATLLGFTSANSVSDTALAFAGGAGGDFWVFRHIGLQFGPVDYVHTSHLTNNGASGQGSLRASGGIAFRFGGEFPEQEPKPPKEPKPAKESKSKGGHRSWIRPWHKSKPRESEPSEGQPAESPTPAPASQKQAPPQAQPPAQPPTAAPPSAPSRGMSIRPLGIVAAPQEFDGARVLQIEPGSVAEMASLHVGDLIKAVDGKTVRTPMELAAELSDKTGKVRITIARGDMMTETVILLGAH